jgi:hypothetical protein
MSCPYCPIRDPAQKVIVEHDLVLFLQDERYQGALKHSGVIIPVQHKATVLDVSEAEITATFRLSSVVKPWICERCPGWLSHRLELRHYGWSRGVARAPACHAEIATGAAGWKRHQDAAEVRRESMVSTSTDDVTLDPALEPPPSSVCCGPTARRAASPA